MGTYVLVHGAWHGGWCWQKMRAPLQEKGHTVFTPTLTGLGERVHLANPDINLTTHIQDILNFLKYEDLHDVVLVGHSYGGMVITGVADQARERIRHLVYLDAFLPEHGQSMQEIRHIQQEDTLDDQWRVRPMARHIQEHALFGVTNPADIAWIRPRITMQPLQTFTQRLYLTRSNPHPRRSYILAEDNAGSSFPAFAARLQEDPQWQVHKLIGGHDIMVTRPQELADLLHAIG
jgi:pimeloyl-ACP methyl ester carboxylesterase